MRYSTMIEKYSGENLIDDIVRCELLVVMELRYLWKKVNMFRVFSLILLLRETSYCISLRDSLEEHVLKDDTLEITY